MPITSMIIKAQAHIEGIEIIATPDGALVTQGDRVIGELKRSMEPDAQFAIAVETANAIYGSDPQGRPNADTSTIHTVLQSIRQVAGC